MMNGQRSSATFLRHDAKVTSDKITLRRVINDVAQVFPDVAGASPTWPSQETGCPQTPSFTSFPLVWGWSG
jgi:hypothetical protein